MPLMAKLLSIGIAASMAVGAIVGWGINAVDASGEVGAIAFVLGACIAGLIGGAVNNRVPPQSGQQR